MIDYDDPEAVEAYHEYLAGYASPAPPDEDPEIITSAAPLPPPSPAAAHDGSPWHAYDAAAIFTSPLEDEELLFPGLDIGKGRPCGLVGAGGAGKNDTIQSLALAVAAGVTPFGADRFAPSRQGRVIHLTYDMGFPATALRYRRLADGMGLDAGALVRGGALVVCAHPEVNLTGPGTGRKLLDAWIARLAGFTLAILDNARDATPGKDENSSDFAGYLNLFGRACSVVGCVPVYLHHAGKNPETEGGRGTSAITAASGAIWQIRRTGDLTSPRHMKQLRQHDTSDRALPEFWLTRTDVDPSGGFPLGSRKAWRLEASEEAPARPRKKDPESTAQREALVLAAVQAAPGASGKALEEALRPTLTPREVREALEELEARGVVVKGGAGNRREWRSVESEK